MEGSGGEIETIGLDVRVGEAGSEKDFFLESVEYDLGVNLLCMVQGFDLGKDG